MILDEAGDLSNFAVFLHHVCITLFSRAFILSHCS